RFAAAVIPGENQQQDQQHQQSEPNFSQAYRHQSLAFLKLAPAVSPSIALAAMTIEPRSFTQTEINAIAARIRRPGVLVGMLGLRKSTVGRTLAQLLGLPFTDPDAEIERPAQRSVPEIFAAFGQD